MGKLENKSLFSNETLDSIAMAELYGGVAVAGNTYCGGADCNCIHKFCGTTKCYTACTNEIADTTGDTFIVGAIGVETSVLKTV